MVTRSFFDSRGLHLTIPTKEKPTVRITGFILLVNENTFELPKSVRPSEAYANFNSSERVLQVTIPHNPENNYDRELYVAQYD
jgi:hypothetical protein